MTRPVTTISEKDSWQFRSAVEFDTVIVRALTGGDRGHIILNGVDLEQTLISGFSADITDLETNLSSLSTYTVENIEALYGITSATNLYFQSSADYLNNQLISLSASSLSAVFDLGSQISTLSTNVLTSLPLKADLVDGIVPVNQLPNIAITDTFIVSASAGLITLTAANQGDVGIVTDISKTFILRQDPFSVQNNWIELATPTDSVLSVNGHTGVVWLSAADIPGSLFIGDVDLAISTHNTNPSTHQDVRDTIYFHTSSLNNPHQVTKTQVGLSAVENISILGSISSHNISTSAHQDIRDTIFFHSSSLENPHQVTKTQVGLSNVENLSISNEISSHNTSISAHSNQFSNLTNHLSNYNNPHQVTKTQVGLSAVENLSIVDTISSHNINLSAHQDIRYDWYLDGAELKRYDDDTFSLVVEGTGLPNSLRIISWTGNPVNIVIRTGDIKGDLKVTEIGYQAFMNSDLPIWGCETLVSVYMDDLLDINENGFLFCTNLTTVNAQSLTTIGTYAFRFTNITSITSPNLTTLRFGALYEASSLTSLYSPNLIHIFYEALNGTSLTELVLKYPSTAGGFSGDYMPPPASMKIKVPYEYLSQWDAAYPGLVITSDYGGPWTIEGITDGEIGQRIQAHNTATDAHSGIVSAFNTHALNISAHMSNDAVTNIDTLFSTTFPASNVNTSEIATQIRLIRKAILSLKGITE